MENAHKFVQPFVVSCCPVSATLSGLLLLFRFLCLCTIIVVPVAAVVVDVVVVAFLNINIKRDTTSLLACPKPAGICRHL